MVKVYLLRHTYEYGLDDEHECTKELGIYSNYENAKMAIEYYKKQPGFCRYPEESFVIEDYVLDKNSWWTEGFISWEEAVDEK